MKVSELKELLEGCNTNIVRTLLPTGQDPFVLYPKKYKVTVMHFQHLQMLQAFFKDKSIIAMDCGQYDDFGDVGEGFRICAGVSDPRIDYEKMSRLKKKANEQATD
jgi:hypothetical protein